MLTIFNPANPAGFHQVRAELPKEWPAGHALAVELLAQDRFGNATPAPSPPIRIHLGEGGPVATALTAADQGRRTVWVLAPWRPGEQEVRIKAGEKELWSGKVKLTPGAVRSWLRLGPFVPKRGARPQAPPPPRGGPEPGLVQEAAVTLRPHTRVVCGPPAHERPARRTTVRRGDERVDELGSLIPKPRSGLGHHDHRRLGVTLVVGHDDEHVR